ncbi:dTDP-4-dehydrorhamnose reductase [Rickettsiales bacterium]|nr:dTDP-4-dehydrorhamnose reductase [Rickettsiales bacterium]
MPIIVTGRNGQVGSALCDILSDKAIGLSRNEVDLSDPESLYEKLEKYNPSAIINAAAYTAVDKAEEEKDLAFKINAHSPAIMAKFCKDKDIPFITYSTDYVYSGEGNKPHNENSPKTPLNIYGKSKLEGENLVREVGGKYIILRVSWIYDSVHQNFVKTMLRLGKEREDLRIVNDQIGAPTYAPSLAKASIDILNSDRFYPGIYNLCPQGETSWYDYALEIFTLAKDNDIELKVKNIEPVASSEFPTPAKRPLNSRLDCSLIKEKLNIELPHWKNDLKECMEKIGRNKNESS